MSNTIIIPESLKNNAKLSEVFNLAVTNYDSYQKLIATAEYVNEVIGFEQTKILEKHYSNSFGNKSKKVSHDEKFLSYTEFIETDESYNELRKMAFTLKEIKDELISKLFSSL